MYGNPFLVTLFNFFPLKNPRCWKCFKDDYDYFTRENKKSFFCIKFFRGTKKIIFLQWLTFFSFFKKYIYVLEIYLLFNSTHTDSCDSYSTIENCLFSRRTFSLQFLSHEIKRNFPFFSSFLFKVFKRDRKNLKKRDKKFFFLLTTSSFSIFWCFFVLFVFWWV